MYRIVIVVRGSDGEVLHEEAVCTSNLMPAYPAIEAVCSAVRFLGRYTPEGAVAWTYSVDLRENDNSRSYLILSSSQT